MHGTFATAQTQLERAAAMGFDVAYLPPIHPIGSVNRKGPNNTLTPGPDDVGSPWAIGSAEGGHDAVHPQLGTIEDFDAFVARAGELGLEVALDFALQCAPDHPWAARHPEWFTVRPDGTIAYAENPPKKYQDIYPVNFDTDPEGIYRESLRVVLYWLSHGVRIFRVDNPHTKPADFWAWLIAKVHEVDPGVVFLAEAFTRPARLFGLAKAGFSQSYTYFTWRTGRDELREFFEMHRDRLDECRPNCFVNTPDILHESLQTGGPGMFAIRATLAATLAPSWGVYAGFELFEWQPVRSGSEEYLDSEKYQLRPRDFDRALAEGRSLQPWITRLNEIRRAHPALRQLRTLRFHETDNDALLAFSKTDPISGDTVLVVVTLNPFGAEDGTVHLDMEALGLDPYARFGAFDEVSGQVFDWGQAELRPPRALARRGARDLGPEALTHPGTNGSFVTDEGDERAVRGFRGGHAPRRSARTAASIAAPRTADSSGSANTMTLSWMPPRATTARTRSTAVVAAHQHRVDALAPVQHPRRELRAVQGGGVVDQHLHHLTVPQAQLPEPFDHRAHRGLVGRVDGATLELVPQLPELGEHGVDQLAEQRVLRRVVVVERRLRDPDPLRDLAQARRVHPALGEELEGGDADLNAGVDGGAGHAMTLARH